MLFTVPKAKVSNDAFDHVCSGVNIHYEEIARQLSHKNDNALTLFSAFYAHSAHEAVNHLEVKQENPDPSLYFFDAVDNASGALRAFVFLANFFGIFDLLYDVFARAHAVST